MRARRPSHATVVAYLALFVALGGTTYAAATIGAGDIKDDAVRSRHIKAGAVKSSDVADGTLRGVDIAESTLRGVAQWADVRGRAFGPVTLSQSGGIGVQRIAKGEYLVRFPRSLVGKALQASLEHEAWPEAQSIYVSRCGDDFATGGANCHFSNAPANVANGHYASVLVYRFDTPSNPASFVDQRFHISATP